MKLCSACLLGIHCRYDGGSEKNQKILDLARKEMLIPICPEQLGGLPTPRIPAEQQGARVVTKEGRDVSENFHRGAQEALRLARLYSIGEAILKQKSPSCGVGQIYDGTFSGRIISGNGVTAALLKESGIRAMSEEDL
uniref:Uncharacterized conserved protein YbbK, DUF523 family n=1 Tax=Candidatus Kentrum sp. MB TaxID=2138164 RepID=A0A450XBQ9_9GAMM|nr:MAG: Uncharacterized conserved protein YbbK, DUF523 family [Candidatus Kentron sp. MB]VFK31577.1 MAG: Uncharacterized conserved protein YbbK, DUF523 family [Candidatus Kentron sp. MB]VFK75889.1 MAG: Uncharacterized conserved protein YbbK, DUF523 family [Candidatus Kentron sp. MB]